MNAIYRKLTPDEIRWIKDLQDEVAHLKRTLHSLLDGGDDEKRNYKWHELKLTPSEARILRLLLIKNFATREAIMTAVYWDNPDGGSWDSVAVFLTRIRQKMPYLREHLRCKPHEGHYLTPDGKHRLMFELMNPGVTACSP